MLQDKVCLVTGAASGIGRAIALVFAREGAKVVVSDVDRAGGEETVASLRAWPGSNAVFVAADVSDPSDCQRLVARCVELHGRLDVACNNAGISGELAPTADQSLEGWQHVIGVNLSGVFYCMKYELPELLKTRGCIVNVASILGSVGFANAPGYTAAKHGVVGLTRTAALEYSGRGVRINAVGPAFIHTPMIAGLEADPATRDMLVSRHPIGRLGEAREVAELVLWLCSERASFCTGSYIPVDGGYLAQ
jgi:NAD(P)-dependent dehydrogenase (short-subunit alcohol dehydrogenase family)